MKVQIFDANVLCMNLYYAYFTILFNCILNFFCPSINPFVTLVVLSFLLTLKHEMLSKHFKEAVSLFIQ
jgi:hypothetical protein